MADGGGGEGRRRAKNQEMAKYLKDRGEHHGFRHWPWTQGLSYPRLDQVGSAAHRRRQAR